MKAAQVRETNRADLEKKLSELKAELFNLRELELKAEQ